jgi:hypothetical protein
MWLKLLTKYDLGLIVLLILFSFGFFISNLPKSTGGSAEIYIDNHLAKKIPLNVDEIYEIQGVISPVEVEVKSGKIRVIASDCPLHLCLRQGSIHRQGEIIVCLPNRLVIVIAGGEKPLVDGISG